MANSLDVESQKFIASYLVKAMSQGEVARDTAGPSSQLDAVANVARMLRRTVTEHYGRAPIPRFIPSGMRLHS